MMPFTFLLQTGWFELQLDCQETSAWFPSLRERYTQFLSPAQKPSPTVAPIQITLRAPHTSTAPTGNKAPQFTSTGVIFTSPGWEGAYDLTQQIGWVRPASDYFIEEVDYFLRVVCALEAFHSGGMLFHAAGILRDGQAYVFFGHSGAGKTTVSRLSGEANVMNDDLLLLHPEKGAWAVYSTPFFNPTQVAPRGNRNAPLARMFQLVQNREVYLENASPGQTLAELIASIPVISTDPRRTLELIARCQVMMAQVPVYRLHFRKDDTFWKAIEEN